jgi:hypothetical protein
VPSLRGDSASTAAADVSEVLSPSQLDDDLWRYRSNRFQGLSFGFAIRCDDDELGQHIESLLSSLRGDGTEDVHWYSLINARDGSYDLYRDDQRIAVLTTAARAIEWLIWDINRSTADASNQHLLFHAGGVEADEGAVLLPAPSGGGKSTLVTGLVQRGLGYLSDELMALSAKGSLVYPYPKPITLKPGSFEILAELAPAPVATDRFAGEEWYVRPDDLRVNAVGEPCGVALVIVPRYVPAEVTRLAPLSSTEAFLALTINSVNLDQHGEQGAQTLADLIGRCSAYELITSDNTAACDLILEMVHPRSVDRG